MTHEEWMKQALYLADRYAHDEFCRGVNRRAPSDHEPERDALAAHLQHLPLTGREATRWHELKTDPFVWDDVAAERKTFEIRLNDRNFKVGDGLLLRKTRYTGADMKAGHPLIFEGEPLRRVITHILHGPVYGLADRWAILSIAPLSPSTDKEGGGEGGDHGVKGPDQC